MKTQKGMQTLITNWAKRSAKKFNADCLVDFEDIDNRSFYFKYDGFIYDCLYYTGGLYSSSIRDFDKAFGGTGWGYDCSEASVMVIYKEDT